jgi:hypothetical protein
LDPVLREIDDLGRLVKAARVAVVGEAMSRGEMRSDLVPSASPTGQGSRAESANRPPKIRPLPSPEE